MRSVSGHNAVAQILRCLPLSVKNEITQKDLLYAEELRLRCGAPPMLVRNGHSVPLCQKVVTAQEIGETVMRICNSSVYAVLEQMKNGFLLLPGGVRIGLAGRVLSAGDAIENIRDFTGLNFRIPHEATGCADKLLSHILQGDRVRHTVLISPPGGGKTTVLRDLVRALSVRGFKICVIDERDEICAMHSGLPAFDIGENTDVLRLCPKVSGVELAVRTLSPQVIITDELWGDAQKQVMQMAAGSGCSILTTVHGSGRAVLEDDKLFEVYVTLGKKGMPGVIREVYTRV